MSSVHPPQVTASSDRNAQVSKRTTETNSLNIPLKTPIVGTKRNTFNRLNSYRSNDSYVTNHGRSRSSDRSEHRSGDSEALIHDFVLLNGINQVAGVQAGLRQTCDEIKRRLNS